MINFEMFCLDIKKEIILLLQRRELYYLSLTSKIYNQLINFNQIVINTIQDRLKKEFGQHYDITILIKDSGIFISGSFIIQCILNEDWSSETEKYLDSATANRFISDSDINMFCPYQSNNLVNLYTHPIYGKNYKVSYIEHYIFNTMNYLDLIYDYKNIPFTTHHPILYHIIQKAHYVIADNTRITMKVITIDALDIVKDIGQYFKIMDNRVDFDVCKNIYYNNKLYIKDMDGILNKKITFNCKTQLDQSMIRYHKYKFRGFVFDNKITYENLKDADYCEQRVFSSNNIPLSLSKFIKVNISDIESKLILTECIKDQCLICFCDGTIKHQHYMDREKYPTQHDIYLI